MFKVSSDPQKCSLLQCLWDPFGSMTAQAYWCCCWQHTCLTKDCSNKYWIPSRIWLHNPNTSRCQWCVYMNSLLGRFCIQKLNIVWPVSMVLIVNTGRVGANISKRKNPLLNINACSMLATYSRTYIDWGNRPTFFASTVPDTLNCTRLCNS